MKHFLNVSVGCGAWYNYVWPYKVDKIVWEEMPEGKLPVIITVDAFFAIEGRIACSKEELDKIINSGENTRDYFLISIKFAVGVDNDRDDLVRDLKAGGLIKSEETTTEE